MYLELKIKYIFLVCFLSWTYQALEAQPKVEIQNTSYARPGHDVLLRLKITRNDASGPARLTYNLVEGMRVKSIDLASGHLRIQDNKMIISWLALPTWDTMFVHCLISIPPNVTGKVELNGDFNYFKQSKLSYLKLPPVTWDISRFWKFKVSSVRNKELLLPALEEPNLLPFIQE